MKNAAAILIVMTLTETAFSAADLAELNRMSSRFAPTDIRTDLSHLSAGDRSALAELIRAARIYDDIFMDQLWGGAHAMLNKMKQDHSALGRARLQYFWINKGPWSDLDGHAAFLPDVPARKPLGANFYPEDMSKEQFETWVKTLPAEKQKEAEGFFTVIRRQQGKLTMVPYSQEYGARLDQCATLLRQAAGHTTNATLKHFLASRADAFRSNDYYASDVAWMDLDSPLDVTIGPYETYNDELFGYKAGFEAYVNLRDEAESVKVRFFANHLQEMENNLPMDPRFRNPKIGALAPIVVVNEVYCSGDAAHGVQTAAYNLPNDERVVQEKGAKRVMLRNVQEAKFKTNLMPIAGHVLSAPSRDALDFDSFFTHILAHELSHGIGPQQINVNGRQTTARKELKELYSTIEEAKADATGLFMLQFLNDHNYLKIVERRLYITYLASSFRTLRFGLKEAHGKGMAIQFNYLMDKGAFVKRDGRYEVDFSKIKSSVRDLVHDLLTLEATGNYAGAKHLMDTLGVIRPEEQKTIDSLKDVPVDIAPVFVTATSLAGSLQP
jgi:Peptidase family M49